MNLRELKVGQSARILSVGGEGSLRQHFLDMGVIPGAQVTVVKFAPMGDPMELKIHGYELTLRLADAEKIEIAFGEDNAAEAAEKPEETAEEQGAGSQSEHPGLGEGG
ncbi:MAG: ferrous iron transport protein A, partial [Clostridia bacterium]|nr:ferrous iron transport protein A [Clostridia bacterium]